jgi:hypothetical protein
MSTKNSLKRGFWSGFKPCFELKIGLKGKKADFYLPNWPPGQ